MDSRNSEIAALLIISKGGMFKSIYHLDKILGRIYGIWAPFDLLHTICEKGWATSELIKQIHYYTVTEEGQRQIDSCKDKVVKELIEQFPNHADLTRSLCDYPH